MLTADQRHCGVPALYRVMRTEPMGSQRSEELYLPANVAE
jgi:hypothetical protein